MWRRAQGPASYWVRLEARAAKKAAEDAKTTPSQYYCSSARSMSHCSLMATTVTALVYVFLYLGGGSSASVVAASLGAGIGAMAVPIASSCSPTVAAFSSVPPLAEALTSRPTYHGGCNTWTPVAIGGLRPADSPLRIWGRTSPRSQFAPRRRRRERTSRNGNAVVWSLFAASDDSSPKEDGGVDGVDGDCATGGNLRHKHLATVESDLVTLLRKCRTVGDVDRVLRGAESITCALFADEDGTSGRSGSRDVRERKRQHFVTPNLAAAALRRVVDLAPLSKPNSRIVRKHAGDGRDERELTRSLLASLLEPIDLASLKAVDHPRPLNRYAVANVLYAVARIAKREQKKGGRPNAYGTSLGKDPALAAIDDYCRSGAAGGGRRLGSLLRRLVRSAADDVVDDDECDDKSVGGRVAPAPSYRIFVASVGPRKCREVLWSLAVLRRHLFRRHDEEGSGGRPRDEGDRGDGEVSPLLLLDAIGDRLQTGDALDTLTARDLSVGLWSLAEIGSPIHRGTFRAFCRRLRKRDVREHGGRGRMTATDVLTSTEAATRCVRHLEGGRYDAGRHQRSGSMESTGDNTGDGPRNDPNVASLRNEAKIMCYTLTRVLLVDNSKECENDQTTTAAMGTVNRAMASSLQCSQLIGIMKSCEALGIDAGDELYPSLSLYLVRDAALREKLTCRDIGQLLDTHRRLRLRQPEVVRHLGRRLRQLDGESLGRSPVAKGRGEASALATILGSVAVLFPGRCEFTREVYEIAERWITVGTGMDRCPSVGGNRTAPLVERTTRAGGYESGLLTAFNEYERAIVLWSFSRAQWYSPRLLMQLGNRVLEKDVIEQCSPSSASRILWSFASVLSSPAAKELNATSIAFKDMRRLELNLFDKLGPILLSTRLSPVDISSAMWAMAKASYPLDMGIFDHLAELFSHDEMLERATSQQICHALWACGKMTTWEDPLREEMEYGVHSPPPYLIPAKDVACSLVSCIHMLSPKDVAQAVWALARLDISETCLLHPLALKSIELSSYFNAQEVANVMWGFSKLGYNETEAMEALAVQLLRPSVLQACSAQEAASVLYAHGKLRLRNEVVFAAMSNTLMTHLNDATPQAIANALWAHESVHLSPPQELFDCWAKKKLGIVGLTIDHRD